MRNVKIMLKKEYLFLNNVQSTDLILSFISSIFLAMFENQYFTIKKTNFVLAKLNIDLKYTLFEHLWSMYGM